MQKKYYWIVGAFLILVGVGIFFVVTTKQNDTENPEPGIAYAPYVDVEATVTNLSLDDLHSDCEAPEVCPEDKATLRIDQIIDSNRPDLIDLEVGDKSEFDFKYSARPAKLRRDLTGHCGEGKIFKDGSCVSEGCEGSECMAASPQYENKPARMEGDYIIYYLPQKTDEVTEETLPGLKQGSGIKVRIWKVPDFEIRKYEIIP